VSAYIAQIIGLIGFFATMSVLGELDGSKFAKSMVIYSSFCALIAPLLIHSEIEKKKLNQIFAALRQRRAEKPKRDAEYERADRS
jgi:hypothetical protein